MGFGRMQLALFVDNLFDTKTITNYNWTIDPSGATLPSGDPNPAVAAATRLQRQFGFRPRTFGLSFTYR